MDHLLYRAELAIHESRQFKNELHDSLAKAQKASAQANRTVRLARAENDRAKALLTTIAVIQPRFLRGSDKGPARFG